MIAMNVNLEKRYTLLDYIYAKAKSIELAQLQ